MTDLEANRIIFGILLFIIFGIIMSINMLTHFFNLDSWVNRMRNNAGNISTYNILMWLLVGSAIYMLIYWIFFKPSINLQLTPSPENGNNY